MARGSRGTRPRPPHPQEPWAQNNKGLAALFEKRSADYLLLYPSFNNYDVLYDLRRKTGHNYVELMKLCGPKDNITTVFNAVGPPLRRNIFEVIHFDEDDDDD